MNESILLTIMKMSERFTPRHSFTVFDLSRFQFPCSGYRSGCIEYRTKMSKQATECNIQDIRRLLTKQKPHAFQRLLTALLAK